MHFGNVSTWIIINLLLIHFNYNQLNIYSRLNFECSLCRVRNKRQDKSLRRLCIECGVL